MTRALAVALTMLAGCSGQILGSTPGGAAEAMRDAPGGGNAGDQPVQIPSLPAASTCQATSVGRSYRGLAGEVLEAGRVDTAPAYDRLRPLPNPMQSNEWSLLGRVQRSVGGDHYPHPALRDPSVGNTFGNTPPRWYDEADVGAFSLSLVFNFAFDSCLYAFEKQRTYWNTTDWFGLTDTTPTPDTAQRFCAKAVRHALAREPRAHEVAGCIDTILDVVALGEEIEPRRQWAFAIATPMHLTY
jgi:hypothetical protein